MTHTRILLVIPLLLWFDIYVSAKVYNATPTCPKGDVSCMTLSQYATQPNNYFASNTTLILLPGNHSLDSELKITNITHLSMTISASLPNTTVTCSQSVGFIFEEIRIINISGITFVGCVNNSITSVEHLTVEHCTFDGQYHEWTGLDFESAFNVTILNSSFTNNNGGKILEYAEDPEDPNSMGGGAIFVNNSNVFITHCVFSGNIVNSELHVDRYPCDGGGAMYIINSNVSIDDCQLINNSANGGSGGAVFVWIDSSSVVVTIRHSRFINNCAGDYVGGIGGVVYVYNSDHYQSSVAVTIYNSTFINNTAYDSGAVSIDESTSVIIDNCMFVNNTVYGDYGSGGAVTVNGVIDTNITINSSTFINNIADGEGGAVRLVSFSCDGGGGGASKIDNSIFLNNGASNGSGGGIYCLAKSCKYSMILTNINFTNNSANDGAAIYLAYCDLYSDGYLNIDSNVANNSSVVYAQVSEVSLSGTTTVSNNIGSLFAFNSNVTLSGITTFMNNLHTNQSQSEIQEGGAITTFQSNLYFHDTVNMLYNQAKNGGALSATESKVYMYGSIRIAENRALQSGGSIYAFQTEFNIMEHSVKISGNKADKKGGGMYAISSTIKVLKNSLLFIGNSAERGGGVCLELNAKLYIIKTELEWCYDSYDLGCASNVNTWPRIVFTNNSADYGGAVYVTDDTNSGTCSATPSTQQSATSECFFQVLALYIISDSGDPEPNNFINLKFSNNTANTLSKRNTIFGGLLDRCTVSPFAEISQVLQQNQSYHTMNGISYLLSVTNIDSSYLSLKTEISSNAVRICFCNKGQPHCYHQPPIKNVTKGRLFTVSLVAVDQVNNTVPNATIHSSLSSRDSKLSGGQAIQQTNDSCTELKYNAFSPHENETLLLYAEGPCNNTGISANSIKVIFSPCPVGFYYDHSQCSCHTNLTKYITNCSIDNQTVLKKGDSWIKYDHGFIIHPHCPFDYCSNDEVSINFNIPNGADAQCAFNRIGILCGSCGDGLSLSLGSSRCRSCSNNWLPLLILFAMAGIALVALVLVFNLTVAVGTMNGLIFYANVIAANRAIFLTDKFLFFNVFIAWLNLDFGFETCFYDGMDGYAKVWLQLAFPCYIIFLVAMIIVVCEYSRWFSRLLSYTNPVATLATLILLSYTKLLRAIIAALSFTTLKYPNGSHTTVWLYDGNVSYLEGKHIGLFVVALLILIVGLVYTLLLIFWQFLLRNKIIDWLRKNHNTFYTWYNIWIRRYLYSFMDVYHAPYNTSHRYWIGLLLLVRVLLYLISAVNVSEDPSVNLLSIVCLTVLLLMWKLCVAQRIYRTVLLNRLDTFFLVNTLFFSATTEYFTRSADSNAQKYNAYASTSIAFIAFLGIICYQMKRLPQYLYAKLVRKEIQRQPAEPIDTSEDIFATAEERVRLLSSVCSQTEIDGLPYRGLDTDDSKGD